MIVNIIMIIINNKNARNLDIYFKIKFKFQIIYVKLKKI